MSEQINNREYRKKVIKDILRELHKGANTRGRKRIFKRVRRSVRK